MNRKQTIRLNEAQLKRVVAESVKRVLNEGLQNWFERPAGSAPSNYNTPEYDNASNCYSVWVGGGEVNDTELSRQQALDLAAEYLEDGYDDVQIVRN